MYTDTILIVDDDIHIGNLLEETLAEEGYRTMRAYSGTEAAMLLKERRPDLVLLDLMLPGLSGEELLPEIADLPVIVVSAKAEAEDKVKLLLGGACDYVTKPFDIRELLARIRLRLLEVAGAGRPRVMTVGDLRIDANMHRAFVRETEVALTPTEYAILKAFLSHPSQVQTRTMLLDRIGTDTADCTESSLKTHISNLRGKLMDVSGRDYIEAVWGIGYKLRTPES